MEKKGKLHVENTLQTYISDWEYCNRRKDGFERMRDGGEVCRFCEHDESDEHVGDYSCALFDENLYSHAYWIKRCEECLEAATPYIEIENEEDV